MSNPYSAPTTESELIEESVEPDHPAAGPSPEPLKMAAGEILVTVYSTTDVVEAEMLTQLLQAEGIPTPLFSRLTGAQAGLGTTAAPHLIRVPASKESEARELVEAMLQEQESNAHEDDDYEPPRLSDRRVMAKKGLALLILGPMALALLAGLMNFLWSLFHFN